MNMFLEILSVSVNILTAYFWFKSMKLYFIIKAYKEGRKFKNIIEEHFSKGKQYYLSGDFIEYFPVTFIFNRFDGKVKGYDFELIKMYNKKAKFEMLFWFSFSLNFIMTGLVYGFEIKGTGY